MINLLHHRFIYITGKGGVGKSVSALALGEALTQLGKKVAVCAPAGAGGFGQFFGDGWRGKRQLQSGLTLLSIEPEAAITTYLELVLKSRRVAKALMAGKVAQGFLKGVPGLESWALLGQATYLCDSETPEFDCVIFDGPATGDGTDLLRVPQVLAEVAPPGRLRRDAQRCQKLLLDTSRSRILPVTILEELPVTEVGELIAVLENELHLPVGPLILNRVETPIFTDTERAAALALAQDRELFPQGPENELQPSPQLSTYRHAEREEREKEFRAELSQREEAFFELPELNQPPATLADLSPLVEVLAQALR